MKVLVIGAAGKSGRAVVEQALTAGRDVTAFVHKTQGYLPESSVHVIEGDARDRSTMDSAMLGQDAVIDTIGGKLSFKTTTLEASAAATIIASMQSSVVRRLVVISVIGKGESIADTNVPVNTPAERDKGQSSDGGDRGCKCLDWIIVRAPFLSDDPGTGNIRFYSLTPETLPIS